jgi:membrane associated rhomboid family serine protease
MEQASVGFHCPECVRSAAKRAPVYTVRTLPSTQTWAVFLLMALNVGVFVLGLVGGGSVGNGGGTLYREGVLFVPAVAAGEWYRLITSGFLHYGIIHLGMNRFALYIVGPQLERRLGALQFLALYFTSMLAGSLGAMILSPSGATAGASGAIFGLFGAALAFQLSNKINIWQSGLGGLILINLVVTFAVGISTVATSAGPSAGPPVRDARVEKRAVTAAGRATA